MIGDPMKFLNELKHKLAIELGEESSLRQAHNNALQTQNKGLESALKDVQNTSRRTYKGTHDVQIQQKLSNYSQKYGTRRNTSRTNESSDSSRLKSITKHQENGYSTLRKKQYESNSHKTQQGYAQKPEADKPHKTIKQPPPPSRSDDYINSAYETEVLKQVGRKQEQELESQKRMLQQLQANELRLCEELQQRNRQLEELKDLLQFQQKHELPLQGLNYHNLQSKIEEKDQIIQNYIRIIETLERKRPRALLANKDVQTDNQEIQLDTNCAQAMRMQTSNGLGPNQLVLQYLDEISYIADYEDQQSNQIIIKKLNNLLNRFKPSNQILLFSKQSFGDLSSNTSKTADFVEPIEMVQDLQQKYQDKIQQIKKLEDINQEQVDKIFQVENDLRNAHLELQMLTLKVFELEEDKQKQINANLKEKNELIDEVNKMKEEQKAFQKERIEINQKISQFQERFNESSQKMLQINQVGPQQGILMDDSLKENEQSESTAREEERLMEGLVKEIQRLKSEQDDFRKALQQEKKQSQDLVKHLEYRLDETRKNLMAYETQLEQQKIQSNLKQNQLDSQTDFIEELNKNIKDQGEQIKKLNQEVEIGNQNKILLEQKNTDYSQLVDKMKEQNKMIEQYEMDSDKNNQQIQDQQNQISQLIGQNQEDFETIQKLQAIIKQNQDHITKLDNRVSEQEKQLVTKTPIQNQYTQTEKNNEPQIQPNKSDSLLIAKQKGEIFDLKIKLNEVEAEYERKLLKLQGENPYIASQDQLLLEVQNIKREKGELFKTIDDLNQVCDSKDIIIQSQENQINFLDEEVRKLEESINQKDQSISLMTKENAQLKFQVERYENLMKTQEEQIQTLEKVQPQRENSDMMLQIENLIQTNKELQRDIESHEELKKFSQQQTQEYQSLYQSLQQEKVETKNLSDKLNDVNQQNQNLQEEITKYKTQAEDLKNEIEQLTTKQTELEQTKNVIVNQMSIQGEVLESYKQTKEKEIQKLKLQLEDLELKLKLADTSDLEVQLKQALEENRYLQQSKSAFEREIQERIHNEKNQELMNLAQQTEQERSQLDIKLNQITNQYNDLLASQRRFQKQIAFKEFQLFVNQKRKVEHWQLQDLMGEIDQLQIQNQDFRKTIEDLNQEKQQLSLQIKQQQAEITLWQMNYQNMISSTKKKQQ